MLTAIVLLSLCLATGWSDDSNDSPMPCSSDLYHHQGKCGGAEHGYFRCQKGFWCSQKGYCGTTEEYQDDAICPCEQRDDTEPMEYGVSPDEIYTDAPDDFDIFTGAPDGSDTFTSSPDNFDWPAPCSSSSYHLMGKCGGVDHGYLRCPQGYWCSQYGYCGTTAAERENAICPQETRPDPSEEDIEYEFTMDDQAKDFLPQDDTEAELLDQGKSNYNCRSENLHRWKKCGTVGHGNFRCKYGEWCSVWGYCGKWVGSANNALCPRETRPNPVNFTYVPTPDDDPDYVEPLASTTSPMATTTINLTRI